jgi:hypothetical protein
MEDYLARDEALYLTDRRDISRFYEPDLTENLGSRAYVGSEEP